jgi:hypothetical protein
MRRIRDTDVRFHSRKDNLRYSQLPTDLLSSAAVYLVIGTMIIYYLDLFGEITYER